MRVLGLALLLALLTAVSSADGELLFVAAPANDVLLAAARGQGAAVRRFATLDEALRVAKRGSGLLLMAESVRASGPGAPQRNSTENVTDAQVSAARPRPPTRALSQ